MSKQNQEPKGLRKRRHKHKKPDEGTGPDPDTKEEKKSTRIKKSKAKTSDTESVGGLKTTPSRRKGTKSKSKSEIVDQDTHPETAKGETPSKSTQDGGKGKRKHRNKKNQARSNSPGRRSQSLGDSPVDKTARAAWKAGRSPPRPERVPRALDDLTSAVFRRDTYILTRHVFLRLLAIVHLLALWSYIDQYDGLNSHTGILPANRHLHSVRSQFPGNFKWKAPSLAWYVIDDIYTETDDMVWFLANGGMLLSAWIAITGWVTAPMIAWLWATYLTLAGAGQTFYNFQWDSLLIETTFLSIFIAPLTSMTNGGASEPPYWMFWGLIKWLPTRLMFMSGLAKLNPTWTDGTAMNFHYETTCLPTPLSWYFHHLPEWFHQGEVYGTFALELILPALYLFGPRKLRYGALVGTILFQVVIQLTGNYTFFNFLTAVLMLIPMDDAAFVSFWPKKWLRTWGAERWQIEQEEKAALEWQVVLDQLAAEQLAASAEQEEKRVKAAKSGKSYIGDEDLAAPTSEMLYDGPNPIPGLVFIFIVMAISATMFSLSLLPLVRTLGGGDFVPTLLDDLGRTSAPFRIANHYGLFGHMTRDRPELQVEVSRDGVNWIALEFKYKPGDPYAAPRFIAPYHPRLDWQMWFAALGTENTQKWTLPFVFRLMTGSREVWHLLADAEAHRQFDGYPPQFVRITTWTYEYSEPGSPEAKDGAWWTVTRGYKGSTIWKEAVDMYGETARAEMHRLKSSYGWRLLDFRVNFDQEHQRNSKAKDAFDARAQAAIEEHNRKRGEQTQARQSKADAEAA